MGLMWLARRSHSGFADRTNMSRSSFAVLCLHLMISIWLATMPRAWGAPATLAAWTPGQGLEVEHWLFQPGEKVTQAPDPAKWATVRLPFVWTLSKVTTPQEFRRQQEWARDPAK